MGQPADHAEQRAVGADFEAHFGLQRRLVGALGGQPVGGIAGSQRRIGGRVPDAGIDAVQDAAQVAGAVAQQGGEAVAEMLVLDFAGVGRADGRQLRGQLQAGFQEGKLAVVFDVVEAPGMLGQAERAQHVAAETPLEGDVVYGNDTGGAAFVVQPGGGKGGLPVVAMNDIGLPGERRGGLAEQGGNTRQQVEAAAAAFGGVADLDDALLEEVTALVEWPVVLTANFEEKFLAVPAEALVHTMKGDQKYFPVYDKNGKLLPKFIFVTNIESKDPSQIISGNEKVVRPRLSDAEFFFKTDLKQTLASRLPRLETVLFQQQLGTVKAKVERIETVAGFIAERIGADVAQAKRAGLLSKCDLMTNMVGEFTDTQGVMGMHYARHDGEDEAVAVALNEQYMPRFAGDALPSGLVACAVALADKFDTLAGIFGIGMLPKGDKDPFALRRAAIGALRIMTEKQLDLDLVELVEEAVRVYGDKLTNKTVVTDVVDFMLGRFRAAYQDEGIGADVVLAVLARRPTRPLDFDRRVKAVSHFRTLDAALALAAANKRVSNILAKVEGELPTAVKPELLVDAAEKALATQVAELQAELAPLFAAGDYQAALTRLAALREPVDTFFNEVMVMADDEALKANRLALLNNLRNLFLQVADISLLQ